MITRERLSELVWSKPLAEAAEELGETTRSLIGMCNILSVARPKPSYWKNRKAPTGKKTKLQPHAHILIRGAKEHFENTRPINSDGFIDLFKSGYLKPYKKLLVDITTSKDCLDKALSFANDLFSALERAGYRPTLAPSGEHLSRDKIDERESGGKRHRSYFDQLWSPKEPTVVYIGSIAVGLAIVEMSEEALLRHVGDGKYIRESDYVPPPLSRYRDDRTQTTTHHVPSGRLRLFAYSPYYRIKWSTSWQETKDAPLRTSLKAIVKSIEDASIDLAGKLEEADRIAEIARLERLAAEERRNREEDKNRVQKSVQDSRAHLGQIIQQWAHVVSLENFFREVERRASELPDADRGPVLERIKLAREFLGSQDPLDFLLSWKTPLERYQPRYSDE